MRTGHFTLLIRTIVGLVLGICSVARGGDDFNEQRLQDGRSAYQQKKFIDAIDEFRVAAFGLLDRPAGLSECLARLALAQAAAGQARETDETVNRFLEVERRFGVYGKTNLEPDVRADFQSLLLRSLPLDTLSVVPSLAGLVETDEQEVAKLPAAERRKALQAWAKREPDAVRWQIALARDAMERGDAKEAERRVTKALSLDPGNADAKMLQARVLEPSAGRPREAAGAPPSKPTPPASSAARPGRADNAQTRAADRVPEPAASLRQILDESRRLISAGKAGDAVPLLSDALKKDPASRELRLALLEAACLSRSYPLAVAQVPMSAPFTDREASSLFYAAVALYETGHGADARGYLQRALPGVSGPLVDEYSQKILGNMR
jgi:tetratricopeptide (TPR) repeat protein